MTATPITDDPLELVKLINLCKPAERQIATDFDTFAANYLDDTGDFTEIGRLSFLDDIAGHLSYLNREGDVRQFARPILREVLVPLVDDKTAKDIRDFDVVGASLADTQSAELKAQVDDAKQKYDAAIKGFTKGNTQKIGKVCDAYPANIQSSCQKLAKKYATRIIKTAKERSKEWKDRMAELAKQLKIQKGEKTANLKTARTARKDYPAEFKEYEKSGYYKLKQCEQQWKHTKHLDEFVESQPGFYRAKELEETIKAELVTVEDRLKSEVAIENARIRSYQNLLKTDLNPLEAQVVRSTIQKTKARLDKTKKRNVKWMKRVTQRADVSLKELVKYQKNAKKFIQKSIKDHAKEERRFAKAEDKAKELEEDAEEDLTEEFKEAVVEAQQNIREELQAKVLKDAQKTEKALAKEQAAKVRAAAKEAKEQAAKEREAAKAQKEEEKQKAREAKATRKQLVKERAKERATKKSK